MTNKMRNYTCDVMSVTYYPASSENTNPPPVLWAPSPGMPTLF